SSSRRHTRSERDWSSDVCSSDLGVFIPVRGVSQSLSASLSTVQESRYLQQLTLFLLINDNGVRIMSMKSLQKKLFVWQTVMNGSERRRSSRVLHMYSPKLRSVVKTLYGRSQMPSHLQTVL